MNAEEERYVQACNQESLKLGPAGARLCALRSLKLKTAIKVLTILQRSCIWSERQRIDMRCIAADVNHHVTRAAGKIEATFLKQESHCSPVHQLLFNAVDPRCSNLVASVGGNQVSTAVPSACAYTKQNVDHRRCACVEASACRQYTAKTTDEQTPNVQMPGTPGNSLRQPTLGQSYRRDSAFHERGD
jgi:hypothetical protein